jgi:hypothetical protein
VIASSSSYAIGSLDRLALVMTIHEDRHVSAVDERGGEVESANAEVDHADSSRHRLPRETLRHLDGEGVVAHEHVADAGHQNTGAAR